jgi:hypothetical protein
MTTLRSGSQPPSSVGSPADIALSHWSAITVRVAWTLLAEGVRVRSNVLRDARDHVLYQLHPEASLPAAEDLAASWTMQFVAQARKKAWEDAWPQDHAMPLSPRWRRILDAALQPGSVASVVFKLHYGDGRPLDSLERLLSVDSLALDMARGGVREVVRRAGVADGLPLDSWPTARIDGLIRRLAAYSPGPCPPMLEVVEGRHRDHVHACSRCDRAVRLVRSQILTPGDLLPPADGEVRPQGEIKVLALHFHPDARRHRDALIAELAVPSAAIGDDLLFVDAVDIVPLQQLLTLAAEVGTPERGGIRGVLATGPGRWSAHGLLGSVVPRGELMVRARSWGSVDGVGDLPEALPEPPGARRWWTAVGALAVVAAMILVLCVVPRGHAAEHPLDASFTPGRGGVWADLDVDEGADLVLVRTVGGVVDVVLASQTAADKSLFATGDGRYRLHAVGDGLLVASTSAPMGDLAAWIKDLQGSNAPLDHLAQRITAASPGADVRVWTP